MINSGSGVLLLLPLIVAIVKANGSNLTTISYRLSNDVYPKHYNIEVTPYLQSGEAPDRESFTFDGLIRIILQTNSNNVNSIILNSKQLNITNVTLEAINLDQNLQNLKIQIDSLKYNNHSELLTIELGEHLQPNIEYILSLVYSGKIRKDLNGFYRSSYINLSGEKVWMAVTQFEPSYARTTFPCFDEPKFKATFTVQINHDNKYKAFSNTKINYSIPLVGQNRTIDVFKKTPIMSTYSVAFLVTDLIESSTTGNLTAVVRAKDTQNAAFGLDIGPKLLKLLEDYTQIPYNSVEGIEKLHMVAVPDFSTGAMENWGLVTFRERLLLSNGTDRAEKKETIAGTITHELAHMWFGNLVTCQWWSYLWLNEGFATYFQYKISHQFLPELEMDKTFILNELQNIFNEDIKDRAYPLTDLTIDAPASHRKLFSHITYRKGASIVQMLEHMVGPENFKSIIRNYLKQNSYNTTTPDNLLDALNEVSPISKEDLRILLRDWTQQTGFPVIKIRLARDGRSFEVTQQQFFINATKRENSSHRWTTPISFTTDAERNFADTLPTVFLYKDKPLTVKLNQSSKWLIVNIRQTGYYRVNYDDDTWRNIGHALKQRNFSGIHVINRAQIIDDLFNLGNSGLVDFGVVLNVVEFLKNEVDYLPWSVALKYLKKIQQRLVKDDLAYFNTYMNTLLKTVYRYVDGNHKPPVNMLDSNFRSKIRIAACFYDVRACIKKALVADDHKYPKHEFYKHCTLVRKESSRYWDLLFEREKEHHSARMLSALYCTTDAEKTRTLLNYTLERSHEPAFAFYSYSEDCTRKDIFFEFLVDSMELIYNKTYMKGDIDSLLSVLANMVTTEEQFKQVKDLSEKYLTDEEELKLIFEDANSSLQWNQQNLLSIQKYLKSEYGHIVVNKMVNSIFRTIKNIANRVLC